jgi:hypothetical protein
MLLVDLLTMVFVKKRVQKNASPLPEIMVFFLGLILLRVVDFQDGNIFSHGVNIFLSSHLVFFLVFSAALREQSLGVQILSAIRKPWVLYIFYFVVFVAQMMTLINYFD